MVVAYLPIQEMVPGVPEQFQQLLQFQHMQQAQHQQALAQHHAQQQLQQEQAAAGGQQVVVPLTSAFKPVSFPWLCCGLFWRRVPSNFL